MNEDTILYILTISVALSATLLYGIKPLLNKYRDFQLTKQEYLVEPKYIRFEYLDELSSLKPNTEYQALIKHAKGTYDLIVKPQLENMNSSFECMHYLDLFEMYLVIKVTLITFMLLIIAYNLIKK